MLLAVFLHVYLIRLFVLQLVSQVVLQVHVYLQDALLLIVLLLVHPLALPLLACLQDALHLIALPLVEQFAVVSIAIPL